ncbi:hypothetical protein HNY73_005011 [Argiope bruennichi]|uniref:Uncharacterized protein n=1 Tax=Argiope bruennichi TaxID=94029 RepID=A0A8T0FRV2_ARGBR|nr:hypothetical protein HNY73_005011 [Argiope bruennichi]
MAEEQQTYPELREILSSDATSLVLQPLPVGEPPVTLHCDVSLGRIRPFVPENFRREIFRYLQALQHPEISVLSTGELGTWSAGKSGTWSVGESGTWSVGKSGVFSTDKPLFPEASKHQFQFLLTLPMDKAFGRDESSHHGSYGLSLAPLDVFCQIESWSGRGKMDRRAKVGRQGIALFIDLDQFLRQCSMTLMTLHVEFLFLRIVDPKESNLHNWEISLSFTTREATSIALDDDS